MVCLSCTATGERVCLAAEGFGNRHCFLENIADKVKYFCRITPDSQNNHNYYLVVDILKQLKKTHAFF